CSPHRLVLSVADYRCRTPCWPGRQRPTKESTRGGPGEPDAACRNLQCASMQRCPGLTGYVTGSAGTRAATGRCRLEPGQEPGQRLRAHRDLERPGGGAAGDDHVTGVEGEGLGSLGVPTADVLQVAPGEPQLR